MSTRETDALGRWCPFSRIRWAKPHSEDGWHTSHGDGSFNRVFVRPGDQDHPIGNCLGSACMAWRTTGPAVHEEHTELVGLSRVRRKRVIERRGYCGLAGQPGLTDFELTAKASEAGL